MALQVELVEESFDLLTLRGEELIDRFYGRLLSNADVRPMFRHTDMKRQKQMLLSTLVLLRRSLRDLEKLVPALRTMGARHVDYGVQPQHYSLVRAALLESMQELGGDNWKPEYTAAWTEAYQVVQDTMLAGAAAVQAAPYAVLVSAAG